MSCLFVPVPSMPMLDASSQPPSPGESRRWQAQLDSITALPSLDGPVNIVMSN
jgi:hypothetical protein